MGTFIDGSGKERFIRDAPGSRVLPDALADDPSNPLRIDEDGKLYIDPALLSGGANTLSSISGQSLSQEADGIYYNEDPGDLLGLFNSC